MIAAAPAPTSAPTAKTQFESLLTAAMTKARGHRSGRDYALDFGITEETLIRYADGVVCDDGERRSIEALISVNDWSRRFVVNRVKRKRKTRKLRSAA